MLILNNFKWSRPVDTVLLKDIKNAIISKIKEHKVNADINSYDDKIVIESHDNRIFTSLIDNVIPLKPGDKRIKDLGRNYLLSKRTTKEQIENTWSDINKLLTSIGIDCNIVFINNSGEEIVLRQGEEVKPWIKETIYPISKGLLK